MNENAPGIPGRQRTDEDLIAGCLRSDAGAWSDLVDRYSRLVYSIARRSGLDDAAVDDVFQTVFANLVRTIDRIEDRTRLAAWLVTTTNRECWRWRRRERAHGGRGVGIGAATSGELPVFDERPDPEGATSEDAAVEWERRVAVREALAALGEPCRSLIERLFLSPASAEYEAIARDLGMKVGSIGPTRARCLAKLRNLLAKAGFSAQSRGQTEAASPSARSQEAAAETAKPTVEPHNQAPASGSLTTEGQRAQRFH